MRKIYLIVVLVFYLLLLWLSWDWYKSTAVCCPDEYNIAEYCKSLQSGDKFYSVDNLKPELKQNLKGSILALTNSQTFYTWKI